jgi:hypothetical protein
MWAQVNVLRPRQIQVRYTRKGEILTSGTRKIPPPRVVEHNPELEAEDYKFLRGKT